MVIDKSVRDSMKERRKSLANWCGVQVPGSIPLLEAILEAQHDPKHRDEVLAEIWSEYVRAELSNQLLETARRRVQNLPNDLLVKLALAVQLSHNGSHAVELANEAKGLIVEVVALARERNEWLRYVLSEQARIGARLCDASLFSESLKALIADVKSAREFDVDSRLFPELVDTLPDGFCDSNLVDDYKTALREVGESAAQ